MSYQAHCLLVAHLTVLQFLVWPVARRAMTHKYLALMPDHTQRTAPSLHNYTIPFQKLLVLVCCTRLRLGWAIQEWSFRRAPLIDKFVCMALHPFAMLAFANTAPWLNCEIDASEEAIKTALLQCGKQGVCRVHGGVWSST